MRRVVIVYVFDDCLSTNWNCSCGSCEIRKSRFSTKFNIISDWSCVISWLSVNHSLLLGSKEMVEINWDCECQKKGTSQRDFFFFGKNRKDFEVQKLVKYNVFLVSVAQFCVLAAVN